MRPVVLIAALGAVPVTSQPARAEPITVGLEGDLATAYLGSRAPSGLLAVTGAVFRGRTGARLSLGYSGQLERRALAGRQWHFEMYEVADSGLSLGGFAGLRASTTRTATVVYSLQAGYVRELSFTADELHREEIRNCYFDDCRDSDRSGGGAHPNPENAYFVGFGIEWNLGRPPTSIAPRGGVPKVSSR